MQKATGAELVNILLDSFIDARLFGSSFAFKAEKVKGDNGKEETWEPKPEPKTLTGAVQINMGEVLHEAEEVDIHGTSVFSKSGEERTGTFTSYFALRYALIGFSGIANEHSAEISRLTDEDYDLFLRALWHGVRSAANTRTKVGQIPHLLLSIEYKPGEEFQFGRLHDYVKPRAANDKPEKSWASPEDYTVDLSVLLDRVKAQSDRIQKIRYAKSSDIKLNPQLPDDWESMDIEQLQDK